MVHLLSRHGSLEETSFQRCCAVWVLVCLDTSWVWCVDVVRGEEQRTMLCVCTCRTHPAVQEHSRNRTHLPPRWNQGKQPTLRLHGVTMLWPWYHHTVVKWMFSDNGVHLFLRRRNDIMIHILLLYHVHPHSMVIVHEDRRYVDRWTRVM